MRAYLFPGQGSQKKGMGAELFARYPQYVKKADEILGYSIEELCVSDPHNQLNFTAYTQPAIFVVSVLHYLDTLKTENRPDYAAGHSIGEYAALFAAEAFDFETGLTIVKKRAELMSQAAGGLLAAVVGLRQDELEARIDASGLEGLEIANINSPTQTVVGGPAQLVQAFAKFSEGQPGRVIPLKVSGAFHTSYMRQAQESFRTFLEDMIFREPSITVLANYTAQPHHRETMGEILANHLANRVRWTESIEYLLNAGVQSFTEIGSRILLPMVDDIRDQWKKGSPQIVAAEPAKSAFCAAFGFSKPLVAGGTDHGAAGLAQVASLARNGVLAFLDTNQSLAETEQALDQLGADAALTGKYGISITLSPESAETDDALIALCLKHSVRFIEARGYFEPTPALLRYKLEGGLNDNRQPRNRILLRVTDADTVLPFLSLIDDIACPLVDMVSLDLQPWRSVASRGPDQFSRLLQHCHQVKVAPFGRIFAGLGGLASALKPVEAALERGADFSLLGTVFLLTEEAALDHSRKTALAHATDQHFREIFDWTYPAFRTISYSFVMGEPLCEQASMLQELYVQGALDVSALRELGSRYTESEASIISPEFVDACDGMNTFELRNAVRTRVRTCLDARAMSCDAPLPQMATWLEAQGASFPVGAAKLADLIYSTQS